MSHLVVLVLDDIEQSPAILDAWEKIGILGITILASTGLGRVRRAGLRDDIPLMPSIIDLIAKEEIQHRTLFSVVETDEMVKKMISATEEIIGDLDAPRTGFLFVVPVSQAYGFGKHRLDRSIE